MKIISWNIRGCKHPRKIKTMAKKLKDEKSVILFLQETRCKSETLDKVGQRICKGCKIMVVDYIGTTGGMEILWHPDSICLTDWRENHFSLSTNFTILDSVEKRNLTNIYGPIAFSLKPTFLEFLNWIKGQTRDSSWIMGGDFNLITSLGEKKGGWRSMDILQEDFREFVEQIQLVDIETGNE